MPTQTRTTNRPQNERVRVILDLIDRALTDFECETPQPQDASAG